MDTGIRLLPLPFDQTHILLTFHENFLPRFMRFEFSLLGTPLAVRLGTEKNRGFSERLIHGS